MSSRFQPAAVVLAAGQSRRMGQPKLLLPWRNGTVLGQILHQWRALGAHPVAVVIAGVDEVLGAELDRLQLPYEHRIRNPSPDLGMFSSIREAANTAKIFAPATHVAIVLGDQPHLQRETLEELVHCARQNPGDVVQPSFRGRPRHPVILPIGCFRALASSAAETLKEFLSEQNIVLCPSADDGLDLDLDTPEDYARAQKLDSSRPG